MASDNDTLSWKFYFMIVILLGAALGLAEAMLGGFMRSAGLPRSPLVTGIGFGVMAAGLAVFKKTRAIPGVAVMTIFSKWLAVPLLGLPVFCQANAHLAILLNGAFLFAGVAAFKKRIAKGWKPQSLVAGLAAFGAGTTFFALGRFWAPCGHLLSFHTAGGFTPYLLTRVVPAALLAALFFPLGYALGRELEKPLLSLWHTRQPLLVRLAGICTMACLGLTVLLTATGY